MAASSGQERKCRQVAVGGGEERTAWAVYIENLMGVPEKDSAHGAFLLSGE